MNYQLIRSSRRTVAIEIKENGVTVRAPFKYPISEIEKILINKEEWINKCLSKVEKRKSEAETFEPFTEAEIKALGEAALKYIPLRVEYYASKMGVTYGNITIRSQNTRWGSCSSKGNLNFNCLLMLTPKEAIDSVVVHELCHRKQMNHSKKFYDELLKVFPDYYEWDKWLKNEGKILIMRRKAMNG